MGDSLVVQKLAQLRVTCSAKATRMAMPQSNERKMSMRVLMSPSLGANTTTWRTSMIKRLLGAGWRKRYRRCIRQSTARRGFARSCRARWPRQAAPATMFGQNWRPHIRAWSIDAVDFDGAAAADHQSTLTSVDDAHGPFDAVLVAFGQLGGSFTIDADPGRDGGTRQPQLQRCRVQLFGCARHPARRTRGRPTHRALLDHRGASSHRQHSSTAARRPVSTRSPASLLAQRSRSASMLLWCDQASSTAE